jgi:hypothetical protein
VGFCLWKQIWGARQAYSGQMLQLLSRAVAENGNWMMDWWILDWWILDEENPDHYSIENSATLGEEYLHYGQDEIDANARVPKRYSMNNLAFDLVAL